LLTPVEEMLRYGVTADVRGGPISALMV